MPLGGVQHCQSDGAGHVLWQIITGQHLIKINEIAPGAEQRPQIGYAELLSACVRPAASIRAS